MKPSDRFDRKRRRLKPWDLERRRHLRRPWFLRCLVVWIAPAAVKAVEMAILFYELFRK
jgi:hypothetical protein